MSNRIHRLFGVRLLCFVVFASVGAGCLDGSGAELSEGTEVRTSAITASTPLYLRQLTLFEDGETVGDPEIYVICKSTKRWSARKDIEYANDTEDSYTPNIKMMDVASDEWPVSCEVWEGDNMATGQDFLGYGVFTQADLTDTNGTRCAHGLEGDVSIGVSKTKGPNLCPELAVLGIKCDQKCTNIRWY